MRTYLQGTIRWDNKQQVARFKRAAERVHWSLNRLMLIATEKMVGQILDENQTAEELTSTVDNKTRQKE